MRLFSNSAKRLYITRSSIYLFFKAVEFTEVGYIRVFVRINKSALFPHIHFHFDLFFGEMVSF